MPNIHLIQFSPTWSLIRVPYFPNWINNSEKNSAITDMRMVGRLQTQGNLRLRIYLDHECFMSGYKTWCEPHVTAFKSGHRLNNMHVIGIYTSNPNIDFTLLTFISRFISKYLEGAWKCFKFQNPKFKHFRKSDIREVQMGNRKNERHKFYWARNFECIISLSLDDNIRRYIISITYLRNQGSVSFTLRATQWVSGSVRM